MIPDDLIYTDLLCPLKAFCISCTVVTCLLARFLTLTPALSRQQAEMTQATYVTSKFLATTQINP